MSLCGTTSEPTSITVRSCPPAPADRRGGQGGCRELGVDTGCSTDRGRETSFQYLIPAGARLGRQKAARPSVGRLDLRAASMTRYWHYSYYRASAVAMTTILQPRARRKYVIISTIIPIFLEKRHYGLSCDAMDRNSLTHLLFRSIGDVILSKTSIRHLAKKRDRRY